MYQRYSSTNNTINIDCTNAGAAAIDERAHPARVGKFRRFSNSDIFCSNVAQRCSHHCHTCSRAHPATKPFAKGKYMSNHCNYYLLLTIEWLQSTGQHQMMLTPNTHTQQCVQALLRSPE